MMQNRWTKQVRSAVTLTAIGASLLLNGCGESPEYGGMTFDLRTNPPVQVTLDDDGIELPVGIAFLIKALPVSANSDRYTASDDMELSSANESILGVYEYERITKVVLVGVREGNTCMRVEINGRNEACIPVRVVENPGLSGDEL